MSGFRYFREKIHSTQMCMLLKPVFSRHEGDWVQITDEPTGNLDSKSCKAVIDAFLQAKKEMGATIFMVTHDSFAASFCDRVVVLKDGRIYGELTRSGARREFMDELLNTIRTLSDSRMPSGRTLGGDSDDHE